MSSQEIYTLASPSSHCQETVSKISTDLWGRNQLSIPPVTAIFSPLSRGKQTDPHRKCGISGAKVVTWPLATSKTSTTPTIPSGECPPITTISLLFLTSKLQWAYLEIMAIPVVEFSRNGYKIRFWLKINCSQMKLLNFENWSSGELSKIGHQLRK